MSFVEKQKNEMWLNWIRVCPKDFFHNDQKVFFDKAISQTIKDTAEYLRPIKHKNPPRDDFDKGADAARFFVHDECDKLIKELDGKK